MTDRIRGRKGQDALRRRRHLNPVCAHCAAEGIDRQTDEIDHIVPLALGGQDVDDNVQGLCFMHHAIKTAMEGASSGGAANHPDWLMPSRAHLTIVFGPPCGGKSTLVDQRAAAADMVIDLDRIAATIRPGRPVQWDSSLLNAAIRARNVMLGALARMPEKMRAYFVVSAATTAERMWWRDKLKPADIAVCDAPFEVCIMRAQLRPNPEVAKQAVRDWFVRKNAPWRPDKPKRTRQAFDENGDPIQ